MHNKMVLLGPVRTSLSIYLCFEHNWCGERIVLRHMRVKRQIE